MNHSKIGASNNRPWSCFRSVKLTGARRGTLASEGIAAHEKVAACLKKRGKK